MIGSTVNPTFLISTRAMPIAHVNGIDLYYESQGKGRPVVLIAGFGMDHRVWQYTADVLSRQYRVIYLDNRGVGQSSCPDHAYTVKMMAEDTIGLIATLGLSSADFVGASFGGCVVQEIAARHPEIARSATILCSPVKASPRLLQFARLRIEMLQADIPSAIVGRFFAVTGLSNDYMTRPGSVEQLVSASPAPVSEIGLKQQLHAMSSFDSRSWVGEIRCPTLLISADEDMLVELADVSFMASVVKRHRLHVFEKTGHNPWFEQPDDFHALLLDFLSLPIN
ncbi:hypothetical protein WI36_16850 [Burkholderia ubonensis]|uniref:Uncharacterized protein n=1 Tax=Burkholderia ubonensis TaxID=101571 RepID=A0A102KC30_9BURK|nr:alpha/beta hydrolase [Burkholderia ubonensis]AOI68540.1 hypothetical protein WI31_02980 [Burkholderia ubonensis]KUZ23107.1 hypothetical protein WI29_13000 [Burkholderia ubonensis]KUZ25807.1 hypothetical protein WI32_32650 [Burkholderia ubonensis]KUZ31739.1 hypothetical protein WI30_18005 [Burkholderia ubonensis]KUZ50995.1 hypothetical protein WI34_30890 [Burkholderia ubonensis]